MTNVQIFRSCALVAALLAASAAAAKDEPAIEPVASLEDGVWLKGDLHLHSRHSTESSNNPISKIVGFAEETGLDFLAITDHDNHVDGDVAHHTWADPEFASDSVLLLYGAEWTTHRGHGNTFSSRPYDHQRLYDARDERDVTIGAIKQELGIHLSANHPAGGDHFGFSFDLADSVEVWNSAIWERNAASLLIWDDMLKSGRMLAGRGGSDAHHGVPDTPDKATAHSIEATANYAGTPTTWVFATERTGQAVVDALTNGRVSISANPYDPRVEFYADLDEDGRMDLMMGDNARSTGEPIAFEMRLAGGGVPGAAYKVKVVKNGEEFGSFYTDVEGRTAGFTDTPALGERSYYRVEVEGPQNPYPEVPNSMALSGIMVGLSNPIYFNFDPDL